MRRLAAPLLLGLLLAGCRTLAPARGGGPLGEEGSLYLYVQPFPEQAERLALALASVAVIRADGTTAPLELAVSDLSGRDTTRQRLLARGRLQAGDYAGLLIQVRSATLARNGSRADLLVGEPVRIEAPFTVARGRALVRWLDLSPEEREDRPFAFTPRFAVIAPPIPNPDVLAFVLSGEDEGITVLDRFRRQVFAVLPTGPAPGGLAFDVRQARLYVALSRQDEIQVLDALTGAELKRIPLQPGDEPREVALAQGGQVLLVSNRRSATVSFVDPAAAVEVGRVEVGQEPARILVDRSGLRAYVMNARGSSISALDVSRRAVVRTVATENEPIFVQLNRAGTRLYLIHASSAYMDLLAVPELSAAGRVFVGLGVRALKVDPRTDLVYVGRRDDDRLQIFDPFSFVAIGSIALPDAPGDLVIDDVQNLLLAALPERGSVAFVDLTQREMVSVADVGPDPVRLAVSGERR
jgi:DNA-binding beta-propeller fold protein YncE